MSTELLERAYSSVHLRDRAQSASSAARELLVEVASGLRDDRLQAEAHPLGFLCLRWHLSNGRTLRLHLWSRRFAWRQVPDWQIHDHVFGFRSLVLAGTLLNKYYVGAQESSNPRHLWPLYAVAYDEGTSSLQDTGSLINIRISSTQRVHAEQAYDVEPCVLHRTKLVSQRAASLVATVQTGGDPRSPRVVGANRGVNLRFSRSIAELDIRQIALEFVESIAAR